MTDLRIGWDDVRESCRGVVDPRRWWAAVRHPGPALQEMVGTGPVLALLVLFGLNAVDELDRSGFGILLPNVRDAFGMSNAGILTLVGLTALGALVLQLPIAVAADRGNRIAITLLGALLWAVFSIFTGAATAVWMLVVARMGSGIGGAVVGPTHNSLLSDWYPVDRRAKVFSFHQAANAVGQFVGPLAAGLITAAWGWRAPFFVFAVPTLLLVAVGLRLREPVRGAQERLASGEAGAAVEVEEPPASFAESWRTIWKIELLRRIWYAIPFLAVSIVGYVSLAGLVYADVFHLSEVQRGYLAASVEPFQLVGLAVGAKLGTRLFLRDPSLVFRFLKWTSLLSAVFAGLFALAPTVPVAVVTNICLTMVLAVVLPGVLSVMSMAIPSRARAVGFAVGSWWAIPGLALLPFIGWIADHLGTRVGMLMMAPVLAVGGLVVASAGKVVNRDLHDVWSSSAARSRALLDRQEGRSKLLVVTDLNVGYGGLQVLFDVSLEVAEGEVVALMGTNGAGKSTLLRAVTGLTEADYGSVILDGRDITHCPPNEIAALGVGQVPGGQGTFGSLTVAENLDVAGWMLRKDRAEQARRTAAVLEVFPELVDRLGDPAVDLSGGQQQMLALAMALVTRPRLLVVDELSLGLAPVVVGRLAELVAEVAAGGTTVLLVEQSINVALSLATTAVFMERGRVRFSGPAEELAQRPDLLRAVFLDGGGAAAASTSRASFVDHDAPPALELSGVVRRFGGNVAVDSVDLRVQPGEIVGLVGQNGAGKTTVIDLVSGLQPLDGGTIRLGGTDLAGRRPSARARMGLGRTFQGGRLFPGLVVSEAVSVALERSTEVRDPFNAALRLPAAVESEDAVAERVDELLELFGLTAYRDTFTAELSTGTRRIVELACVVAHQPTVLLLDEPAAGVAQREVEQLGDLLVRIRDELGCALVVVEHDVPLLARIADRLVALEAGRVIAEGPPAEVLDSPEVVRSYLGDVAVAAQRSGPVGGSISGATDEPQGDHP